MNELFIGLMSGTSLDAIDGVVADLTPTTPLLIHAVQCPILPELKARLLSLCHAPTTTLSDYAWCDIEMGRALAATALRAQVESGVDKTRIRAIGCHGQTIFHQPQGTHSTSLQIGDPNIIAETTGIATVADFRRRDIAAGGQGAPLVPAFHHAVFGNSTFTRVVANIGGMANITLLPAREGSIIGFDTGPGNVLMDAWMDAICHEPFDRNGSWAAAGRIIPTLLERLLADEYFHRPPPKSTGREHFNLPWLRHHLSTLKLTWSTSDTARDIQRTLCELTAVTLANAIKISAGELEDVIVCGGGAFNTLLCERLQAHLPRPIKSSAEFGINPQHVEALAFAWLAQQTLHHRAGNVPSVTGAHRPVVLGAIYPAAL